MTQMGFAKKKTTIFFIDGLKIKKKPLDKVCFNDRRMYLYIVIHSDLIVVIIST